jgi:hypothetical protein
VSFFPDTFLLMLTLGLQRRVARFFLVQHATRGENIPKDHKIYLIINNCNKNFHSAALQNI